MPCCSCRKKKRCCGPLSTASSVRVNFDLNLTAITKSCQVLAATCHSCLCCGTAVTCVAAALFTTCL